MYYLEKNVYIVDGKTGAAIYDFNNELTYHVNKAEMDFIHSLLENRSESKEDNFIKTLLGAHILTQDYVPAHSIDDLKEEPIIDFVWIELTTKCNLKCIHCYEEAGCHSYEEMSFETFQKIVSFLQEKNIKKIQLIGGEPFMKKDLKQYLDYIIDKFEFIEIFTNGTLVNDNWFDYFKQHNIHIALSVYSYREDMHNYVTKNKYSHQKTMQTIQKLKDYDIPYRVENVLMNGVELGEKNTDLFTLKQSKDVVRMSGRASWNLYNNDLLRKKAITKERFQGKPNLKLMKKIISGHNCFSRRLYFDCHGTIYPCVMERRLSHGTINDIQLDSNIFSFTKDKVDGCKDCEYRYACFDCRPDSIVHDFYAKPWYCTYNPHTGIWTPLEELEVKQDE